jgi:dTDP-4-dehydrorhamnose 3,5-epimerase
MAKISSLEISGLLLIEPEIHPDERGLFFELYKGSSLADYGLPAFVQDNVSISKKNVIRGLHFQSEPYGQGKFVAVLKGRIFDVAVDVRKNSPSFGKYVSVFLDDASRRMMYVPPGFAHGFCALSDENIVLYKNTKEYCPEHDNGIIWNDPKIGIDWPCKDPLLSKKDSAFSTLREISNQW